ncbi:metallophosphoesterase [Erysipelothrix urinaevulpis]|uniref:metallophosphoesterase n=1 Tax=Erysipelothrix urinaevulpis TaxID=2683717 RepID=UPI001357D526|nr:metallophosphoesterase [Erysipelothrix urinaevulpis]
MKKLTKLILSALLMLTSIGFNVSTSIVVDAESKYHVIEDFEGSQKWEAAGARFNELDVRKDQNIVRFDKNSLFMGYDFNGTEGVSGVYAQPTNPIEIPGAPKKLGMWIYGDGAGHWLRFQLKDSTGQNFNVDLTGDHPGGVNWQGWKYVEAPIADTWKAPFTIDQQGIRYMATKDDRKNTGGIYVDKIIALYEDDINEDVTNPQILKRSPEPGETIVDAKPYFHVNIQDLESGIDDTKITMTLDGQKIVPTYKDDVLEYKVKDELADGLHEIFLEIFDHAGNHHFESWTFRVDAGNFSLEMETQDKSIAGDETSFDILAKNFKNIDALSFSLKSKTDLESLNFDVNPELKDHFELVNNVYVFKNLQKFDQENMSLGKITYSLSASSSGKVVIEMNEANYTTTNNLTKQFYIDAYESNIIQPLTLSIEGVSVGTPSTIRITDLDNQPVEGAEIQILDNYTLLQFKQDGEILKSASSSLAGDHFQAMKKDDYVVMAKSYTTSHPYYRVYIANGEQRYYHVHKDDVEEVNWNSLLSSKSKDGKIETDKLTLSQLPLKLQAKKGKLVSQVLEVQIAPQLGEKTPQNKLLTWVNDARDSIHVSWKTDTSEKDTVLRLKEMKSDSQWITISGDSELIADATGEFRVHHVEGTDLKENTSYEYQVGDGENFSEPEILKTAAKTKDEFTFTLVADSQAYDEKGFQLYANVIEQAKKRNPNTEFLLHAGDIVEEGNRLDQWDMFLKCQDQTNLPLMSVMGNHDVYGQGTKTYNTLVQNPKNGPKEFKNSVYYQDYGDVRFIVLNSEVGVQGMQKQVEWLKETVTTNPNPWTIVSFHRSPYKANPKRPDDATMKIFAPVLEALDVDLVLTGHDHSYLRTYPLKDGKPQEQGPIYIIGGSSGPKFYPGENQDYSDVTFAKEKQLASNITVSKTELKLEAFTHEGEVIDEFKLSKKQEPQLESLIQKLENLLNQAQSIDKSIYTGASVDKLESAIKKAKQSLKNPTQENLTQSIVEMESAIENLELIKEEKPSVDPNHPLPQTGMGLSLITMSGLVLASSGLFIKVFKKKD